MTKKKWLSQQSKLSSKNKQNTNIPKKTAIAVFFYIFSCKSTKIHYNPGTMKPTEKIVEFLFPKTCVLCGTTGAYLCSECKKCLNPHPEMCPYCHRPSEDYRTCFTCKLTNKPNLEGLIVPFAYTLSLIHI